MIVFRQGAESVCNCTGMDLKPTFRRVEHLLQPLPHHHTLPSSPCPAWTTRGSVSPGARGEHVTPGTHIPPRTAQVPIVVNAQFASEASWGNFARGTPGRALGGERSVKHLWSVTAQGHVTWCGAHQLHYPGNVPASQSLSEGQRSLSWPSEGLWRTTGL